MVGIVCFFPLQISPLYLANFVHSDCAELKTLPQLPLQLEMAMRLIMRIWRIDVSSTFFFYFVPILALFYCLEL